uniref:Secreted protein n=1 Tax=Haemonchus contortus TaxID=6289 RepID=A0A7I4YEE7_HAECO|nr:Protein of unknown function DUF1261 domain containing protein [Haemonchus contortus]
MLTTLLLAPLIAAAVALDGPLPVFSELGLSEAVVKQAFFTPSKDDIYSACESNLLNEAQQKFNSELGINTDFTWRNASSLAYAVNKLINAGADGMVKVCDARRDYAGVLLASYPFCVNRFYLLEQGGTDFNNAVTYVHLYKHLEFMCSTGFDVYQYNLPCIVGVTAHDDTYNACFYKFQQTIQNYPNMLCQASQTLVLCLENIFASACGMQTGWVECEMERLGYAYDCNGLQC